MKWSAALQIDEAFEKSSYEGHYVHVQQQDLFNITWCLVNGVTNETKLKQLI